MTRRSQRTASSAPPPKALPLTAAMMGTGKETNRSTALRMSSMAASMGWRSPFSSAWAILATMGLSGLTSNPAQKASDPPPVTTTARGSGGFASSRAAASICANMD